MKLHLMNFDYPGQEFYRNAGKTVRKGLESEFKIEISKKLFLIIFHQLVHISF